MTLQSTFVVVPLKMYYYEGALYYYINLDGPADLGEYQRFITGVSFIQISLDLLKTIL